MENGSALRAGKRKNGIEATDRRLKESVQISAIHIIALFMLFRNPFLPGLGSSPEVHNGND
jgi:hypothetical protein